MSETGHALDEPNLRVVVRQKEMLASHHTSATNASSFTSLSSTQSFPNPAFDDSSSSLRGASFVSDASDMWDSSATMSASDRMDAKAKKKKKKKKTSKSKKKDSTILEEEDNERGALHAQKLSLLSSTERKFQKEGESEGGEELGKKLRAQSNEILAKREDSERERHPSPQTNLPLRLTVPHYEASPKKLYEQPAARKPECRDSLVNKLGSAAPPRRAPSTPTRKDAQVELSSTQLRKTPLRSLIEEEDDDFMNQFQIFAEDHISVLTGDEETGQCIVEHMHNFEAQRLSRRQVNTGGTPASDESVPRDLLVNYMLAVGADHATANELVRSFEAEMARRNRENSGTKGNAAASAPIARRRTSLVHANNGEDIGSSRARPPPVYSVHSNFGSDGKALGALVVEARPVTEDTQEEFEFPVIYAESTPISLKHMLLEKSIRRIICIGVLMLLGASVGLAIFFVKRGRGGSSGETLLSLPPTISPTTSPTFIEHDILEAAIKLSGEEAVYDPESPQYRAISWMSTFDTMDTQGFGSTFAQRYALVTFYFSLNGETWINQERWINPEMHECDWSNGIFCEYDMAEMRVVNGLDATRNNLQGTIPEEIGLLTSLEILRLTKNAIDGSIPRSIGRISTLSVIDLSTNKIQGSIPESIGNVRDLILLELSNNLISSTIPTELFNLKSLRNIHLSGNQLSGRLHQSVNNLLVLATLDLRNNQLTGTLPLTLDSIESLDVVRLDYNQFTGKLPQVTTNLVRKQIISLSHNQFSGNLELGASPSSFAVIPFFKLQHIDLSYNNLTGPVSPLFGTLPTMRYLDMSGNGFTGTFPSHIEWESIEYLAMSNNQLTGTVPTGYPSLTHLDISNNTFMGGIPEDLCEYPVLEFLFLEHNPLGFTLPDCLGKKGSKLRDIEAAGCRLVGTIPSSFGHLSQLEIMDVSDNDLEGKIPTELGELVAMKQLSLNHNFISGAIPSELGKLLGLASLNLGTNMLSGAIPTELGSIRELEILVLEGNRGLNGTFPEQLCLSSTFQPLARYVGCNIQCDCCADAATLCITS